MATKSRFEQAIESRANDLNDAQREIVMAQLAAYKSNRTRLGDIREELAALNSRSYATMDEMRVREARKMTLSVEYNQLTTANSEISAKLFYFMKEQDGEA